MASHEEEIKRFYSTPPPEADAEFEAYFELFAQEIKLEEVIRERDRWQERYIELVEKHNQPREVSPVPEGLPFVEFLCEAARELQLPRAIIKSEIEDWLRDHWPDNAGTISSRKIAAMATFLRGADSQKGGYWHP